MTVVDQVAVAVFVLLQRLFRALALGDVADDGLENPLPIQHHRIEQHFGGKGRARIGPLVHPLEALMAHFHRRRDSPVGQGQGIRAAGLQHRGQVSRVFRAELGISGAPEDLQGRLVAVEDTVLIQQQDTIRV